MARLSSSTKIELKMTRYASDDSSNKKIIPLNKETSEVEQSLYQFVKPVLSLKKKRYKNRGRRKRQTS